jgi:Na+/melibiose symporter-like transporter
MVPITGTLIAMAVMLRYDLSEQKAHEIREQLETKRGVKLVA